jgi:hypothetical protein
LFALGFIFLVALYISLAIVGGKYIKKGLFIFILYWGSVVSIPVWFFVGHKAYPSYFEFKYLCKNSAVSTVENGRELETEIIQKWIIKYRILERGYIQKNQQGEVVGEYKKFYYYPFRSLAKNGDYTSDYSLRQSCSKK